MAQPLRSLVFAESTLAEIRARLSVVELISEYVQLKKSGQGFQGLCPFHKEKTPSFHVHPLKNCYHCFGCHKGGNIFTFLCEIEGLTFPESVKRLAKRTGVPIEETRRNAPEKKTSANQTRLFAAQEWAAKYFHYLLMETPAQQSAREYVASRGLTEATLKRFRVGVAPKGWNTLLKLMAARGYTLQELVESGLVVAKESSPEGGYDRFRERLIFPITDSDGNTLGFGARQLNSEPNQPKYINSPESPLFSKRKILYGLFENQRGIRVRGEAILVEGYMDVVALFQCGVDNAVATMGTAVTEEHCQQLKSLCKRVVTVFDSDAAGNDAWHRSVHLFLQYGLFAKDLTLPPGKDPDEFVLEKGADALYQLCDKAPRQITKLLKEIAANGAMSEEQTAREIETFTPILLASRKLADRATLWDDISLVLKISLESLQSIVEVAVNRPGFQTHSTFTPMPAPRKEAPRQRLLPVETEYLQAALRQPVLFLESSRAWEGGIRDARMTRWLKELSQATDVNDFETRAQSLLEGETQPEVLALASAALIQGSDDPKVSDRSLFDAVWRRVQQRQREAEIKALSLQVRLSQRLGDAGAEIRLLERLRELRNQ